MLMRGGESGRSARTREAGGGAWEEEDSRDGDQCRGAGGEESSGVTGSSVAGEGDTPRRRCLGIRRAEASGDRRRQEKLRGDALKAISHGRCGFACACERLHAGGRRSSTQRANLALVRRRRGCCPPVQPAARRASPEFLHDAVSSCHCPPWSPDASAMNPSIPPVCASLQLQTPPAALCIEQRTTPLPRPLAPSASRWTAKPLPSSSPCSCALSPTHTASSASCVRSPPPSTSTTCCKLVPRASQAASGGRVAAPVS
ncbi:hypothetical protein ACQJBY_055523 [Aegilops geniculata]